MPGVPFQIPLYGRASLKAPSRAASSSSSSGQSGSPLFSPTIAGSILDDGQSRRVLFDVTPPESPQESPPVRPQPRRRQSSLTGQLNIVTTLLGGLKRSRTPPISPPKMSRQKRNKRRLTTHLAYGMGVLKHRLTSFGWRTPEEIVGIEPIPNSCYYDVDDEMPAPHHIRRSADPAADPGDAAFQAVSMASLQHANGALARYEENPTWVAEEVNDIWDEMNHSNHDEDEESPAEGSAVKDPPVFGSCMRGDERFDGGNSDDQKSAPWAGRTDSEYVQERRLNFERRRPAGQRLEMEYR